MPVTRLPEPAEQGLAGRDAQHEDGEEELEPEPQAITRQRMALRLCDSAMPIARTVTSPTRPDSRLQGDCSTGAAEGGAAMVGAPARWRRRCCATSNP